MEITAEVRKRIIDSVKVTFVPYAKKEYAMDEFDKLFEEQLMRVMGPASDKHFYSRIAGITFKNEDGSSRQEIALKCHRFEILSMGREKDNPYDASAILVSRDNGEILGHLHRDQAAEISHDFDTSGRIWLAIVKSVSHP